MSTKIREVITQEGWTKGCMARDDSGFPVSMLAQEAVSFCLMAWVWKCYGTEESHEIIRKIKEFTGGYGVTWWNDHAKVTFDDVKSIVEKLDI